MHCFIWLTATAALWNCAAAAATSRPNSYSSSPISTRARAYENQDTSRGFYSFGYSDENAARAEYTTQDGSSRGFYSYVDANGKLQTVKYEAGGLNGFKAEASNQPKAPIDDKKPVMDTAEVQEARQAHLNAIREAQELEQQNTEQAEAQRQAEQPLSDEDADILERVRAELTSMLEQRQGEQENPNADEQNRSKEEAEAANNEDKNGKPDLAEQSDHDANGLRMRTVYTLSDLNSSSYLKLSDLPDRLDRENNQEVHVPVTAYYSYTSPNAKYSVTTPTKLRTLRPVALSRSLLLSERN